MRGVDMKKIIAAAAFLLCGIYFSSCAAVAGWQKAGVSQEETENTLAQCEYEAAKDHVERGDFVTNCMKRQGFRYK